MKIKLNPKENSNINEIDFPPSKNTTEPKVYLKFESSVDAMETYGDIVAIMKIYNVIAKMKLEIFFEIEKDNKKLIKLTGNYENILFLLKDKEIISKNTGDIITRTINNVSTNNESSPQKFYDDKTSGLTFSFTKDNLASESKENEPIKHQSITKTLTSCSWWCSSRN
ncbi:MAG TPA: hypothetical protein VHA13_00315 [Gammaproteobacteria bacterium]|nr:hypothetical protein [Gammaproteobacteria bacterium]